MTNKSEIVSKFRKRIKDTEATYGISDVEINAIYESAREEINIDVPHIRATGYITPDGSAYNFDLSDQTNAANFFLLHRVWRQSSVGKVPLIRHVDNMDYIRKIEADSAVVEGVPYNYAMDSKTDLYLDAIVAVPADPSAPTATEKIWLRYFKTTSTLADDGNHEGELKIGWDSLILAKMALIAEDELSEDVAKLLVEKAWRLWQDKQHGIEGFRRYVAKLGEDANEHTRARFSCLGDPDHSSINVNDFYDPGFLDD